MCIFFIARRQGDRFKDSHPQASGYELANQDEMSPASGHHNNEDDEDTLVEETLEDEDDFEISSSHLSSSGRGGGKEHRGLMRLRSSSGENDLA